MDTAYDAFIAMNAEGVIVEWNRQAEATLGWTRAEAIGCCLADTIIPATFRLAHLNGLQRFLATGEGPVLNRRIELTALHRTGREFPVEITIWPTPIGLTYRFNAFIHDITSRKHMERALQESEERFRQAQKMEGIGRLAGGVAHDFNNLLTVINGYSDLLIHQPRLEEPTKHLLREIQKAGERAAGLTQQLLAFSRKQILQPSVLDLNAVLTNTEKMLRRLIGEDVDLSVLAGVDLGRVQADPGQIEQILMNLVVNARDAMPQGGKLTVETCNVFLGEDYRQTHPEVKPGPYVLLSVTDTGCGMEEQTKVRIFEPFFTTKEPGQGTGLGLATVYGIVKQSDGHIEVYSELGIGTAFKVYLPAVDASGPARDSPRAVRRIPPGTETVLLAEDEEGVRTLVKHALQACGYTVLEAAQGQEALEVASRQPGPIDLLVTDVVMPRMGGRELAERLKTMRPGIKVLYLSGYTDDAVLRHGIIAAESAYLQKPFTPASLATKVREVLDKTT
ncbi:MAG: response regulator [Planctomycetes bacterium]|nr:response regulator [Planctomycetota bacterium]